MARSKGTGRGSRLSQRGILSGATIATVPSGVTLAEGGLLYSGNTGITPTEVGYLDGAGGVVMAGTAAGGIFAGGIANWAGSSVLISTGLTTVTTFVGSLYNDPASAPTAAYGVEWVQHSITTSDGSVTAGLMYGGTSLTPAVLKSSGGSLAWMAFGT